MNTQSITEMIGNKFKYFLEEDINFGFYDWFCKDSSLKNKAKGLCHRVSSISKHTNKFNPSKCYVFFKNNCPCCGPLYDSFSICENDENGDVLYCVTPKSGHSGKSEVWGKENDFDKPIISGTWKDVKNFFKGVV